jgi:hypothetical protein
VSVVRVKSPQRVGLSMARNSISPILYAGENKMKIKQEFAGKNIKKYCRTAHF